MNWQDVSGKSAASVAHWQKISQFRARHPAIGAGKQTTLLLKQGYGFVREHGDESAGRLGRATVTFPASRSSVPREAANRDKMSALISVAG